MMSSGDVLVMGGRGRVGREVIRALRERGASVRSLVRAPSGRDLRPNVREVTGDLGDRATLDRAHPVVLMPSNFYQNDALFLPEVHGGRYPQPLGLRGASRVDCRDIGDAAARALLDEDVASGGYPLVGPDPALTGPQCAAVWASALGREVTYDGDLGRWRALVADRMQPRERDDFGKTYELFGRVRVAAKPAEIARTTALLGRPPRSYASYVSEVVAERLA